MAVFEDLKIVDFSWSIVGPMTSRYFADWGATVIRVESEKYPDAVRSSPPFKDGIPGPDRSSYYSNYNINKYGITLNLRNPDAVSVARRLIKWADILLESFRPGTMKKWGLDYNSIKELNTGIIYVSSSMLGQTGPYKDFPGYGSHGASIAGFNGVTGWPDRPPVLPSPAYTDIVAPRFLVVSIIEALFNQKKTGKGRYIDQSQVEAGLQFLTTEILDYGVNKRTANRNGNRDAHAAPHGAYPCAGEDRWCTISVKSDYEWKALCEAMNRPDLAQNLKFSSQSFRKMNETEIDILIGEWTKRFSPEEVMAMLQHKGVPAGIVERAADMHNDTHLKYRNHFPVIDHPFIGQHSTEALAIRLSNTPATIRFRGPYLGEHNEFVCINILGISDEEFIHLVESGAFSQDS